MKLFILGVLLTLGPLNVIHGFKDKVEEVFHWKKVIYEKLPLDENAIIGPYPYFTPTNNDVLGLGHHVKSGLVIVTTGRLRTGVPATLNAFCFSDYPKGSTPAIWGFPDYEKNTLKASFYGRDQEYYRKLEYSHSKPVNYSTGFYDYLMSVNNQHEKEHANKIIKIRHPDEDFSIISTYHPTVDDQCNRLYILDTGTLYYGPTNVHYVQKPAIIIFDIQSNCCETRKFPVIRRVEIPSYLWKNPVGFIYITPDYQGKDCDEVILYITNCYDNSVIVYDYKHDKFWSFKDLSMNPITVESRMVFKHHFLFDLPIGIMNIALGWPDKYGDKIAYYAPGASFGEYAVSTRVLKDPKLAYKNNHEHFSMLGYRGSNTQTFKQVFDSNTGVIFFGEMQSNKIQCWNVRNPINADTVGVVYQSDKLQYVSEIFIDSDNYLWFHSSQLPVYYLSDIPLDLTEVNARAFRMSVSDAIKGTVCESATHSGALHLNHYKNGTEYYTINEK